MLSPHIANESPAQDTSNRLEYRLTWGGGESAEVLLRWVSEGDLNPHAL
jgi:hypothetical protein